VGSALVARYDHSRVTGSQKSSGLGSRSASALWACGIGILSVCSLPALRGIRAVIVCRGDLRVNWQCAL
jgi:hypothetical protein